jgi:protein TonB
MNDFRNSTDMLGIGLLFATALHAFIILGISFRPSDLNKPEFRQKNLDVMVIRNVTQPPKENEQADFLAQTSQAGGGEALKPVKPQIAEAPLPSVPVQPVEVPRRTNPRDNSLTTELSDRQIPTEKPQSQKPLPPLPSSRQLITSRELEIARISAELERKTQAYAKLPKRKTLNANTKESKYAAYLDAWRRKVERIGNLNYPDQARRDKLYGNLILHVAVRSDGTIEEIRVRRSSGHKILDDAAVRIVRLAAPYSPFPNEISEETDILDITRTWQFLRSGQFYSQ